MTDFLGPANAPNAVIIRPAETRTFTANDSWFRDCSSELADDGTDIQAAWLNDVVAKLRGVARVNGGTVADPTIKIVPENGLDDGLLIKAIQHLVQRGRPTYAVAAGTANALVVTLAPTPPEYIEGMSIRVKIAADNTDAAVMNVNGLGNKSVLRGDGTPTKKGDLPAGAIVEFSYNGAAWLISNYFSSSLPARNRLDFGAGTHSLTVPAGIYRIFGQDWAAGGGGGGSIVGSAGGGAGAGGYAEGWLDVVPGQIVPIIVGTGGSPGIGATSTGATAGGNSTIGGTLLVATGGNPGGTNNGGQGIGGNGGGTAATFAASGGNGGVGNFYPGSAYCYGGWGAPAFGQSLIMPFLDGTSVDGFGFGSAGSGGANGARGTYGGRGSDGHAILTF
jgi:hypothetical protein